MASTINASSAGIVETADTSGVLQLQTNGVQALNIDASQNVTIPKNVTITSGGLTLNSTIDWNGYTIPAPTGTTTTFLSNAGTWITPAGSGTGGSSILASNNTFTGTNTFNAAVTVNANLTSTSGYLIDTASGGYAALQSNSVTIGNAQTGMNYSSGQINWQINNTTVAGLTSSGAFTSTSLVPTTGILGNTSGSGASAGYVGEVISSVVSTPVSATPGTTTTVTSITLTPGDWMVNATGNAYESGGTGFSGFQVGINTTTTIGGSIGFFEGTTITAVSQPVIANYNVSTNTTIYLLTQTTGGSGTQTTSGSIYARRMR